MFKKYKAIWISVIIVVLVLGSVEAGAAMSATAVGDTAASNVIYAAYQQASGILRYINDPSQAKNSEVVISWNQAGPQGPQGTAGAAGPQGPKGDTGAQGPQGTAAPPATLLTLADNVNVQPGGNATRWSSPQQDVKSFRNFTLYARLTPAPSSVNFGTENQPPTQPPVTLTVHENALGVPGEGSYHNIIAIPGSVTSNQQFGTWPFYPNPWEWRGAAATGSNPPPARWTNVSRVGGLFSKLNVSVVNNDTVPVTISLYLLMSAD